jgi:hypothetical protein
MPERPSADRAEPARRLRSVTVRVPEVYAESLRLFADELRNEVQHNPAFFQKWISITRSAELMVDADCRARGIIRDTRAGGVERFHWSVIPPGQSRPVAEGRTADLTRARCVAESALRVYAEDWRQLFPADRAEG